MVEEKGEYVQAHLSIKANKLVTGTAGRSFLSQIFGKLEEGGELAMGYYLCPLVQ